MPARTLFDPRREVWELAEQPACQSGSAELFFHEEGERAARREVRDRQAAALCARCPLAAMCAAYADDRRERYGVWGGVCRDCDPPKAAGAHRAGGRTPRAHKEAS